MKTMLIISFLCITPFFSYCQDTISCQEILNMFKKINKSDRTNQKHPAEREKIFIENFIEIKHLIENQGFVNINATYSKNRHRKIIKHGIERTFTHILQTHSELILNLSFIELISNEIKGGRFCNDNLIVSLSIYVYDNDIKSPFKGELKNAINTWGLSESDIIRLSP